LPLTVIPNPALPGVIHTSVALHLVVVKVRVIVIIIPVTLTLTSQVLPQNGPTKRIVALGDSYSSGEGNPPFDLDTVQPGDTCHRSPQAWPRLIGVDASYQLACSGATIPDLAQGKTVAPPDNVGQVARLALLNAAAPIDDVTITIGGNDLGFSTLLRNCVLELCLRNLSQTEAHAKTIANTLATQTYPAIKAATPTAKILVVGYPRLFPTTHADVHNCFWLSGRNLTDINQLENAFNGDLANAARQAGVTFVSTANALNGHELCSLDPWIVPITRSCAQVLGIGSSTAVYCGHPTENGQRAIARIVQSVVNTPTAPTQTTTTTSPPPPPSPVPTLGKQTNPDQEGYGSVRPTLVSDGGDPTGEAENVTWQSWGGSQAIGTGTSDYVTGDESVAAGSQEPVTVVAFDLGVCEGQPAYLKVAWYFPEYGESFGPNNAELSTCEDSNGG